MKEKIISKIQELSNKIQELHDKRENLVAELRNLDLEMHTNSKIIIELSELIKEDKE